MGRKEKEIIKETGYDFLLARKFKFSIGGHGTSRNFGYMSYVRSIFVVLTFFAAMSITTIFKVSNNKLIVINSAVITVLCIYMMISLFSRHKYDKELKETTKQINYGVFHYEKEGLCQEHEQIKYDTVATVRKVSGNITKFITSAGIFNLTIIPLLRFTSKKEDTPIDGLSPYLNYPIYCPISAKTPHGFLLAYLFNVVFVFYGIIIPACMNDIYLSCVLQLTGQLKVLNHSLRIIHRRAYAVYLKTSSVDEVTDVPIEVFDREEYQNCLYECLRSNALHHQAILKLKRTFDPYTSLFILDITLGAVFFALKVFLIMEDKKRSSAATYGLTFLSQLVYLFIVCYVAELLIQESSRVFFSLYETPWFHCSERFKKVLHIMMSYTRNPLKITCVFFDFTASVETYGDVISTMYKIANVMREA